MSAGPIYIGCAGWAIARQYWPQFPERGSHLQRYASVMNACEINTSFYRPHQPATYAKWAASIPPDFRFSVKLPKTITHEHRLIDCVALLDAFLAQCGALGNRFGCLLIQLPPSLVFDCRIAGTFFGQLRARYSGSVVIEPRHESWSNPDVHALLVEYRIAQVAVDPSRISSDRSPSGWQGMRYWRLHGSPRIYHSEYPTDALEDLASDIYSASLEGTPTWCVFDNTASGAALGNAMSLQQLLQKRLAG